MILEFTLTMPNKGSWNGRWTGDNAGHRVYRNVPKSHALKLLEQEDFYHEFGDGWMACVSVTKSKRKKDTYFRGRLYMVNELIKLGRIRTMEEKRKARLEKEAAPFLP